MKTIAIISLVGVVTALRLEGEQDVDDEKAALAPSALASTANATNSESILDAVNSEMNALEVLIKKADGSSVPVSIDLEKDTIEVKDGKAPKAAFSKFSLTDLGMSAASLLSLGGGPSPPPFVEAEEGEACPKGYEMIEKAADCQQAATALNESYSAVDSSDDIPPGCSNSEGSEDEDSEVDEEVFNDEHDGQSWLQTGKKQEPEEDSEPEDKAVPPGFVFNPNMKSKNKNPDFTAVCKYKCFPSSAMVYSKDRGLVRIDTLSQGDLILSADSKGNSFYDEASFYSLANPGSKRETFLAITTSANRVLRTTDSHHIPTGSECCGKLMTAGELRVGDTVWTVGHGDQAAVPEVVKTIEKVVDDGLHSPVMLHGGHPIVDGIVTSFDDLDSISMSARWMPYLSSICNAGNMCGLMARSVKMFECYTKGECDERITIQTQKDSIYL